MRPQFYIQPNSEIPAITQLVSQLAFAIASNQFVPGSRLPSTRQLAMLTGLHRNTISRVFRQLEEDGLIEARAGSGMYVREGISSGRSPKLPEPTDQPSSTETTHDNALAQARGVIDRALEGLSQLGYSLPQIQSLLQEEISWRSQCNAQAIVTVPRSQQGIAALLAYELQQQLGLTVEGIFLEDLGPVLATNPSVTLITTRYFLQGLEAQLQEIQVQNAQIQASRVPIIAADVYTYKQELEAIAALPKNSCVGLVSISPEILQIAEVIITSRRGDDLWVLSAHRDDQRQLAAVAKRADLIICGQSSSGLVERIQAEVRSQVIRPAKLMISDSYISAQSLTHIAQELGLELE